MKQLRLGVIGLGRAGFGMHMKELAGKEEMFKIGNMEAFRACACLLSPLFSSLASPFRAWPSDCPFLYLSSSSSTLLAHSTPSTSM